MKESYYEPSIMRYLGKYGCFKVKKEVDIPDLGVPDVLGVQDVGGWSTGDIELVSVEIKKGVGSFGKNLGQALGYSLLAHRVYLAVTFEKEGKKFEGSHKKMANRLGVGLLEIRLDKPRKGRGPKGEKMYAVEEVLTSNVFVPLKIQMMNALDKMNIFQCSLCSRFLDDSQKETKYSYELPMESYPKRIGMFGWRDKKKNYTDMCRDCRKIIERRFGDHYERYSLERKNFLDEIEKEIRSKHKNCRSVHKGDKNQYIMFRYFPEKRARADIRYSVDFDANECISINFEVFYDRGGITKQRLYKLFKSNEKKIKEKLGKDIKIEKKATMITKEFPWEEPEEDNEELKRKLVKELGIFISLLNPMIERAI